MKVIKVNKHEAGVLLEALEYYESLLRESGYKPSKSPENIREKIYDKFPDLKPNLEEEFVKAEVVSTLAYLLSSPAQPNAPES
ncbi:MAG TPA: hypothetical protein VMW50_09995 [Dehalococcoidia bacterium]|nr:hypothetical protein [Dehalococcoidia bacterium]